ncbi:MAG: hypothetical protein J6W84_08360 [Bacteroidales bacterium]|nr:hypothetical protein [Bacteroidales bacterium]MBQ7490058.1 hypothetical protein [Bacteroidales bacterium]
MKAKVKKVLLISICTVVVAFVALNIWSLIDDPDNYRISKKIYYNSGRKDILDYDGKYEIPPKVTGYTKIGNLILVKWNPDYPIPAIYDKYEYGCPEDSCTMYWIIDLNEEKQIGPMDSISFIKSYSAYGITEIKDFEIPCD